MEDLTTFYKTLRDIYKEDKIKKKKKFLEELIKNKQPNCVFCSKPSGVLCEICVRDVHRDSPDLETTLFCDLFEQYRSIKKMRRIAVYEYLFKQVGSVYNGDSNESDINTLLRRLNEYNFQFNNLIVDIFTSKDEKIMFSNFKMKIHKELIRNYYLINLFYKAEVIEEHLQRMRKEKYDSNEIENEVLNVYKEIYNEI